MRTIFFLLIFVYSSVVASSQGIPQATVDKEAKFIEALKELAIDRTDKAIELLEELYKEDRTNAEVSFALAKAYLKTGDKEKVEKHARSAVSNEEDNVWYNLFLAHFLMDENRPESALPFYHKALSLEGEKTDHYKNLSEVYMLIGKPDKAIEVYNGMERKMGSTYDVIMNKLAIYRETGDNKNALVEVDRALHLDEENVKLLYTKAQILSDLARPEEALSTLKRILEIDPSHTEANIAMLSAGTKEDKSNAYLRALLPIINNKSIQIDAKLKELIPFLQKLVAGEDDELREALIEVGDRLTQTHNDEAKAFAFYGDVLIHTGNHKAAINQYARTLELDNGVFDVWKNLLLGHTLEKQWGELEKRSAECVDYYPNQPRPYLYWGIALSKQGKFKKAREVMQDALIMSGHDREVKSSLLSEIGAAYLGEDKLEEAKKELDSAVDVSTGQNPAAFEYLGDYYLKKGDKNEAIKHWEKSKVLGNSSIELSEKLLNIGRS